MKKAVFIFLSIIFTMTISAQVGIDKSPHVRAALDLSNEEGKGVIFTSVSDYTKLPLYNSAAPDLFDNDKTMEGMIMYVMDENTYYQYDGYQWIRFQSISPRGNKNFSRLIIYSTVTSGCGLGICGEAEIHYQIRENEITTASWNRDRLVVDNLGISKSGGEWIEFQEDGYYRISPSVSINGGGVSLAGAAVQIITDGNMVKSNGVDYFGWERIGCEIFAVGNILGVEVANDADLAYTVTNFYKKGDRIRIKIKPSTGFANGYTVKVDYQKTFLAVEKIR